MPRIKHVTFHNQCNQFRSTQHRKKTPPPQKKQQKKPPTKLRFKEDSKKNNNLDLTGYRAHRTVYNRTI